MKIKLRALCAFMATVMLFAMIQVVPMSAAEPGSGGLQPGLVGLTRKAAAEGAVLLKNNNNALPLKRNEIVSLFGRHQIDYFYVGYGSGGDVKFPYSTNLLTGMRRNPGINLNENLAAIYERWCASNPPSHGSWGNWPTNHPEMPLTAQQVTDAAAVSDAAVVVIGRSAGEDRESTMTRGSYLLTLAEETMLDRVTEAFDKVIVLLNVGNIIDMRWAETYGDQIDSIMYVWQGGMEAGPAVADLLSGDVTPSGKLSSTIARERTDYPSNTTFGRNNFINYEEDIFVGYRYFETFAPEKVLYPFGFGLSYTTFDMKTNSAAVVGSEIVLDITVTNTGSAKGKEVVQVYYGAPQGAMGKAGKSLSAYAKTNLLQPGASETVKLSFQIDDMASYDDAGYTAHRFAWVLEAGAYPIYVGNSARDSAVVFTHNEPALRLVRQLEETNPIWAGDAFDRYKATEVEGKVMLTRDRTPVRTTYNLEDRITSRNAALTTYPRSGVQRGIRLIDVYRGTNTMAEFIDQMSLQQLVDLTRGIGPMGHSAGIPGNASVFGGITTALRNTYGIPAISTTDGPSGIRMSAPATLIPIGFLLACTWNDRLIEELYEGVGKEMVRNGSDSLLAPGLNLHRDPLCGRNFEYFSEDPLLTGQMAANVVRGVQSQGVAATPKHFAANNQETARNASDSRVSERAQRELYLRGFEILVKSAKPQNLMMSYNIVNGTYAQWHYELATTILRDEWGFDGVVMTDWWMYNNTNNQKPYPVAALSGSATSTSGGNVRTGNARRIQAQVDLLKPGDQQTTSMESWVDAFGDPVLNVNNGSLSLAEVQRAVINVLHFALISARFRVDNHLPLYEYKPGEPVFKVEQAYVADPLLTGITVNGDPILGFDPSTREYVFYARQLDVPRTVAATAAEGVTVEIEQPSGPAPFATLYARTAAGGETIYRVFWTNEAGLTPTVPNPIYAYLRGIQINGQEILNFFRTNFSYTHWCWEHEKDDVVVTVTTPPGVDATITRVGDTVMIRAESDHQANLYFVEIHSIQQGGDPSKLPRSDDFAGTTLKDFWSVHNQTSRFSKPDGSVQVITEGGDWYQAANDKKNVLWQYAHGDWTSVSEFRYDNRPSVNYQQIGLMIYDDNTTWLQWRLEYNSGNTNSPRYTLSRQIDNANTAIGNSGNSAANQPPATNGTFYLRVQKTGNVYRFDWSNNGTAWNNVGGNQTLELQDPKFGLFAISGNTGNDSNARITTNYENVTFSNVTYVPPELPKVDIPVVDILPDQPSRVVKARDNFYLTPGMAFENNTGGNANNPANWTVGWIGVGGVMLSNINVREAGYYNITSRYAANAAIGSPDQIRYSLRVDDRNIATFDVRGTGGWQNWATTAPVERVWLDAGLQKLMFFADTEGYNIHWFEFVKIPSFPVTFMVDGEEYAKVEVIEGEFVNRPAAPAKEGHIFLGWFDGDAAFDFDTPITRVLTLTALYEANTFAVRYDANGGTFPTNDGADAYWSGSVAWSQSGLLPEHIPVRFGYDLVGWETEQGVPATNDITYGTFVSGNTSMTNFTMLAQWARVPVRSLKIDSLSIATVARYGTYHFGVILNDNAISDTIDWTVADPSLGYVDEDGNVTIFDKIGNVRLTATDRDTGISHSITLRIAS